MKAGRHRHLSTSQFIFVGFFIVIIIGSFLLMLPCATRGEGGASFFDSLFTATSAVCVTGLVVQDTATYWSGFGQAVILILIQIGGMGVITMAISLTVISGKKIGLMQRSVMQEAIAAPKIEGIVKMTGFIIRTTVVVELIGAMLMYPLFYKEVGVWKGIWYSLFHSISAFCNAGFDLMGYKSQYSSLTHFAATPVINIIVMLLILIGGIGFVTWDDIKVHKWHFRHYRMQSKVILTITVGLIIVPALYFYFCEFSREAWDGISVSEKIQMSLFQSVTPRTAGFNTADLTKLTGAGQLIMIMLMFVGGATGSTAGGMKITTVAVLFATAFAVFQRKSDAHLFRRRISVEVVRCAATILLLYVFLFLTGGIIISIIDGVPIIDSLFETASAICTVGLTLGITPHVGAISRIVLIVLMFFGRVGGLTIIFAAFSSKKPSVSKLPEEKIMVG